MFDRDNIEKNILPEDDKDTAPFSDPITPEPISDAPVPVLDNKDSVAEENTDNVNITEDSPNPEITEEKAPTVLDAPRIQPEEPQCKRPAVNRALELNGKLFAPLPRGSHLGMHDQSKEREFNSGEISRPSPARKAWIAVLSCALCMIMGFFGAVAGIYTLANTGFADSNSMLGNLIVDGAGLEIHKIHVTENDLLYSGGYIEPAEKAVESVVILEELLENPDGTYVDNGSASGVIISHDGYIVTNHHVTNGTDAIRVTLSDGSTHIAEIIGQDSMTDIAVIKMTVESGVTLTPAPLGVSANVRLGQRVLVIGNPLDVGITVSTGIVSCTNREILLNGEKIDTIQTDASVSPGNSGGGMFDVYGNLIGIICAKTSANSAEGLGYAVPIDTVKKVVNDLMDYGFVRGRPAIGITLAYIFDKQSYEYYAAGDLADYLFNSRYGVYIISSLRSTELKKGDRLTHMNGERIISSTFIGEKLKDMKPGDKVTLTVERLTVAPDDGNAFESHNVTIELYERDW
ncbi:MAG: trypsin-like peptidase domain-containing protein [Clostridia bacterium]|nr:trypsin-like peptidase domain-containing protein [Clostridia bacterium]